MLPVPTLDYLAQFTGREVNTFTPFAEQALDQATLLFGTVTGLADLPDDPDQQQLAINAILEMADRLYLEQPHAQVKASPFNSENIGSYSYSKGYTSLVAKAARRDPVGMLWWDTAVEELSQVTRSLVQSGSVEVFDHQIRHTTSGRSVIAGPADTIPPELPLGAFIEYSPGDPTDLP